MEQHPPTTSVEVMHPESSDLSPMAALTPATKHYPAGLRYVRALLLRTEYRKCIQTCTDLLQTPYLRSHPIQKAFLHFYSALAYDEMGRAMHHNSIAKIPALDTAEQSYLAALHALPSAESAELLCQSIAQKSRADSFFDTGEPSPSHDGHDPFDTPSLMSSPARLPSENLSVRSATESPWATNSDLDDLESHDSFSELQTPNRVLNREYSRMSLLETTSPVKRHSRNMSNSTDHQAPTRMQRDFSRMSLLETPPRRPMSQGLLRPIRPGSAPKQFFIPPRLADTSQIPRARAGEQGGETKWSSPRKAIASGRDAFLEDHHDVPEPVSPISRRGSARYSSDISTISAISPLTPTRARGDSLSSDQDVNEGLYLRFNDHLDSMRMQLETHINLVKHAKEQLCKSQAERASARLPTTVGTRLRERPRNTKAFTGRNRRAIETDAPNSSAGLPRLRSFWSFVPEDAKAAEKQRRIQAGRERNWERRTERFDPTKYQDLCERALNEL